MDEPFNRRRFVATGAAVGLGVALGGGTAAAADKPALLGGKQTRSQPFPSWPVSGAHEDKVMLATLQSGKWFRGYGQQVDKFEAAYARLTGAKHCIATNGGTTALIAALGALDIGPGDEVIVTPYTFIASITAIMMHFALPVFVDIDPETFQIDPAKIEAAITDRTAAILPVHIGGNVANLDAILAVAKRHKLPVIEDACQAHLAEWRGRKVGTWGTAGCFSFQVTKNLPSGEGGAVLTNDRDLSERIFAFHSNCRARTVASFNFTYMPTRAANFRMTEFQGPAQRPDDAAGAERPDPRRQRQVSYRLLGQIPGIVPAKMYEGCTRNAWHLYMLRYKAEEFGQLPREKILAGPQRRRHPLRRRLHARSLGVVPQRVVRHPRRPAGVFQGSARRVARSLPGPRTRKAVRRSGLVHAEHAFGHAQRHGPNRRGHPQDPGSRARCLPRLEQSTPSGFGVSSWKEKIAGG